MSVYFYKPAGWAFDMKRPSKEPSTNKDVISVRIGEVRNAGSVTEYIIEQFYPDILSDYKNHASEYKLFTMPGKTPQLFMVKGGHIVLHNHAMTVLAGAVRSLFDSDDGTLLCSALAETAAKHVPDESRYQLRKLAANISAAIDVPVHQTFLGEMLKDYFIVSNETSEVSDDLTIYLSSRSKKEMAVLMCDRIRWEWLGTPGDAVATIAERYGKTTEAVYDAIREEAFVRATTGRI